MTLISFNITSRWQQRMFSFERPNNGLPITGMSIRLATVFVYILGVICITYDISGRGLTCIPEEMFEVAEEITILDVSGNRITELPERISKLTKLQNLDASYNKIVSVPESIGDLESLQYLDLTCNKLTSLPEGMCRLTGLRILNLYANQLEELPHKIGEMDGLRGLYLNHNNNLSSLYSCLPLFDYGFQSSYSST